MKSKFLIATLAVLASGISAWAQAPQKIAVIDMQAALVGTKEGHQAATELQGKFTPKQQDLQKRQTELQAKQDQYRKVENTLSEEAKATMQRDMETLSRNIQRDSQDAQQDLDQEQQRILGQLGPKMQQVINKYATDHQITMVFDVSGQPNNVIFASNTIDITRDIIALYDQAAPVTPTTSAPATKPAPATRPPAATPAPAIKPPATASPKPPAPEY